MQKQSGTLTLIAGGDVGPINEPVDRLAELILPVLREVDFRLAQCERTYSERGFYNEWKTTIPGGQHSRQHPRMASIFKAAEIDVASLASNHALDWSYETLLDTIELFGKMGIQTIGAGINAEAARRPAIVEKNGIRVAILGYCSVLRDGQAAGVNKPGLAAVRVRTYYEPYDFQPGTPPRITTVAEEEDIVALQEDIRKAKGQADAVVMFIHWGLRTAAKTIATYQPPVAHAAIDAGVDIILGHHPHIPKAIEIYKGKACFYSIGNFLTTGPPQGIGTSSWNILSSQYETDTLYRFPIDCKQTILPKITFSKQGIERVSFIPAYINKLAQPEVVEPAAPRFQEMLQYMEWVSDEVPHKFRVEGNEVVVET